MAGRPRKADRQAVLYRRAYREVLNRHKRRWNGGECISFDHFKNLADQPCVYCNHAGSNTYRDYGRKGLLISAETLNINGIDRVDSRYGYTEANSKPCCLYCNRGKNDRKINYFLHWVAEVYHKSVKNTHNDLQENK